MILVYSSATSARLQYIVHFIFKIILGVDFRITTDVSEFETYPGPKINYSHHPFQTGINITPLQLLFEKGVKNQNYKFPDLLGSFTDDSFSGDIPDLLTSSFRMLSRYEEYLPFREDEHGRFEADQSLAYVSGILQKPAIDIWAMQLKNLIQKRYPEFTFPERKYKYMSTIDIDNAYAFRGKGLIRTLGAFGRSLLKGDMPNFNKRMSVLKGREKDPFDTYDMLNTIQKEFGINNLYFFLVGEFDKNDRNLSVHHPLYKTLIRDISEKYPIGIHPSYASQDDSGKVKLEISALARVAHSDIVRSRQHFLRMKLPITYRVLIENEIREDYSMGYASSTGFRAGTCTPFFFYDLQDEQTTPLEIFPFAVMDATLRSYMKISPEKAISKIQPLIDEVKAVNGTFISLWHNESLSNIFPWVGWQNVYHEMVRIASKQ